MRSTIKIIELAPHSWEVVHTYLIDKSILLTRAAKQAHIS